MSLLSGTLAIFFGQSMSLGYQDMMEAMYYTISTHHELFCGPTQKPGSPQKTVTVTKTETIVGHTITKTITPTLTTTRYVTLTRAADDSTSPTGLPDPTDSGSNCYWLAVHELDKANNLYNLTSEAEITVLRSLATQAQNSHDELQQIAEQNLEEASRANGLSELLQHLVDTPLVNSCDTFLVLADQLISHGILNPQGNETGGLDPLFDSALQKLAHDSRDTRTKPAPGVLSADAAEALPLVLEKRSDDARYCFGDDCNWPIRIFEMWKTAEGLREVLKERLRYARSQTLSGESKGTSVLDVLTEIGVITGLYGVFRFLSKMTAERLRP